MTVQEINDAPMMRIDACQDFIDSLPYELTGAQKKVWAQIEKRSVLDTSDEPADSGRCRLWQNHCGSTGDVYVS